MPSAVAMASRVRQKVGSGWSCEPGRCTRSCKIGACKYANDDESNPRAPLPRRCVPRFIEPTLSLSQRLCAIVAGSHGVARAAKIIWRCEPTHAHVGIRATSMSQCAQYKTPWAHVCRAGKPLFVSVMHATHFATRRAHQLAMRNSTRSGLCGLLRSRCPSASAFSSWSGLAAVACDVGTRRLAARRRVLIGAIAVGGACRRRRVTDVRGEGRKP